MPRTFEYRHIVSFQDTNVVGNVYYTNHLVWQGRAREMFLREYAPSIVEDLAGDLRLVTVRCSCDYFEELLAFDEVVVHMSLGSAVQNRILLLFDYFRGPQQIAKGEQMVACMRLTDTGLSPTPIPITLSAALEPFG
jgi:enediyne biosynthesis thioesterase